MMKVSTVGRLSASRRKRSRRVALLLASNQFSQTFE
jgi:hypothetical protein